MVYCKSNTKYNERVFMFFIIMYIYYIMFFGCILDNIKNIVISTFEYFSLQSLTFMVIRNIQPFRPTIHFIRCILSYDQSYKLLNVKPFKTDFAPNLVYHCVRFSDLLMIKYHCNNLTHTIHVLVDRLKCLCVLTDSLVYAYISHNNKIDRKYINIRYIVYCI